MEGYFQEIMIPSSRVPGSAGISYLDRVFRILGDINEINRFCCCF